VKGKFGVTGKFLLNKRKFWVMPALRPARMSLGLSPIFRHKFGEEENSDIASKKSFGLGFLHVHCSFGECGQKKTLEIVMPLSENI